MVPSNKEQTSQPIKSDGDATLCIQCNANTVYSIAGCAVCTIPNEECRRRYSGK